MRGFGVAAGLDPEVAGPLAARCEELGYASMWSNDHPGAKGLETLAVFGEGAPQLDLGVGVIAAIAESTGPTLDVVDYNEHAIGHGADAQAAAYVECRTAEGKTVFGVGMDTDIATASVRAVLSAANRA